MSIDKAAELSSKFTDLANEMQVEPYDFMFALSLTIANLAMNVTHDDELIEDAQKVITNTYKTMKENDYDPQTEPSGRDHQRSH